MTGFKHRCMLSLPKKVSRTTGPPGRPLQGSAAIPIRYACTHPPVGAERSPSMPIASAWGSAARQGPGLPIDGSPTQPELTLRLATDIPSIAQPARRPRPRQARGLHGASTFNGHEVLSATPSTGSRRWRGRRGKIASPALVVQGSQTHSPAPETGAFITKEALTRLCRQPLMVKCKGPE